MPDVPHGKAPTVMERLLATGKRPSGFDYMRLVLAVSIVGFHTIVISYGRAAQAAFIQDTPGGVWVYLLVPMFFALSGFLVSGSLERTKSVISFLGLRVLRIVPALGAEIFLSALILGPAFTALSLGEYVRSHGFHVYFLNIVGDIHYFLPGVFTHNPSHKVNGQLWTIPGELACYATLAALFTAGLVSRRRWLVSGFVAAQIALPAAAMAIPALQAGTLGIPDWLLVLLFLAGVSVFRYRERIPWRGDLALGTFAAYVLLLKIPYGLYFIPAPIAYLTIYLGLLNPPRIRLIESGDYSYGLYLYGYPIQQAITACGLFPHIWWVNFAVALPLAFAFAAASWHLLEKHALALRKQLMALEERILVAHAHGRAAALPLEPQGN